MRTGRKRSGLFSLEEKAPVSPYSTFQHLKGDDKTAGVGVFGQGYVVIGQAGLALN